MPFDPATLPPRLLALYDLRMQALPAKEIAARLGRTPGGVSVDINRLRKRGAVFPPAQRRPVTLNEWEARVVALRKKRWGREAIMRETGCAEWQVNAAVHRARKLGIKVPPPPKEPRVLPRPAVRITGTWGRYRRAVIAENEEDARAGWALLGGEIERVENIT